MGCKAPIYSFIRCIQFVLMLYFSRNQLLRENLQRNKKDAIKEARRQIIEDLINDLAIIRIKQDQEIKELENKLMELSRTQDLTQKEI